MKNNARILLILISLMVTNSVLSQQKVEQWGRFELALKYEARGNLFLDVEWNAVFTCADTSFTVSGFYDGDNTFRIRFMPCKTGVWTYKTSSNVAGLKNQKGSFECVKATAGNHGMVQVSNTYDFKYSDGKYYYPFGTTAYAWTHMSKAVQDLTLASLQKSGFNKVRMCVFPKNYNLVKEEPELYPFMEKMPKVWDFERFNPAFFQHLEQRIDDLNKLGIEADLILFHPYDKGRWGFDAMPNEVNLRYIKYVTARLSSFRNVWWSLANEWDLVKEKKKADWDLFASTVVKADPYRHLCSIHGATATYYEYWKPEFTHISIQDESPVQSSAGTAILSNVYHKPIICDESWDMSIQACPLVFETTTENDYRLYDKDLKKVRLPLKQYMALRITELN